MPDIAMQRLHQQHISQQKFDTPIDVVTWLGAIQAQDYLASLWALGLRLPNATDALIEQAIADRTILRTWPMRGTVHFVPPADARWMVRLLAPRVVSRSASIYRKSGLDETIFSRSRDIFINALEDDKQLTRKALYDRLEAEGINTSNIRGLLIVGYLAQEGLICFGPRQGKQPTFALLEEWSPNGRDLEGEDALAELARRYFISHGLATLQDFVWWSGLTVAEARVGIEAVRSSLAEETIDGQIYWYSPSLSMKSESSPAVYLLPGYDEYLLGYKDRSAVIDPQHQLLWSRGNAVFSNIIVIDGRVVGTWRRTVKKDSVLIEPSPFVPFTIVEKDSLADAAARYGHFLGLTVRLS